MSNKRELHFDGWGNLLSAYQNRRANKAEVRYQDSGMFFTPELLDEVWVHDGYTRRVVSCVAEDMINKGFTIVGDSANIDLGEMQRLNVRGVIYDALCKSRHYGGSAILMGIDDGGRLDEPVRVNSIKKMNFLRVIPRSVIRMDGTKVVSDPNSPAYGTPEMYVISDGISPQDYRVHPSRLYIIPWLEQSTIKSQVQRDYSVLGNIWGTPILSYMYKQIGNLATFHDALSNLAQEAVIGKYKVSGLAQLFANGEESKVMKRMDIINEAKSVINAVMIDADNNEDYERDSLSFAGINGVADTMMVFLSGVSGIPVTRLFGRSPSGLDASGESDLKIYYDMVSSYQDTMLTPFLQKLTFYIDIYKKAIRMESPSSSVMTVRNGTNKGETKKTRPSTESDITIKWTPLNQMTEKESAEAYYTNAQADTFYINAGVLSREEVRINRFLGGYNQEISVESADVPDIEVVQTTTGNVGATTTAQAESKEKDTPNVKGGDNKLKSKK